MSGNGIVAEGIKKVLQGGKKAWQGAEKKLQGLVTELPQNKSSKEKNGKQSGKEENRNAKSGNKPNRPFNESELLEQMKRDLDKKYELEQEMARLAGGDTGLVQLRMRLRKAKQESDSGSILFFEEIFCEKKARLEKKRKDHKAIIARYQKYKGKCSNSEKERRWEDLIWRLTKEDDNERLYKELLQYPCGNEKKQGCNE